MKRWFEVIVLGSVLAVTGCTMPYKQTPPIKYKTKEPKALKKGLDYMVQKDYASARSYLEKYPAGTPSIKFAIAMSYAADGTIFNGGLLDAGERLEKLIYQFEDHPRIIEQMQDNLTILFTLEEYKKSKRMFRNCIFLFPKQLTPLYAFMCTVDQSYEKAAKAWDEAKEYWPHKFDGFINAFLYLHKNATARKDLKRARGYSLILKKLQKKKP